MLFLFRIGSKPVLVAFLSMLAIFFSACSDSSENELGVFKALDESLANSNFTLTRSSQTIYMELEEKLMDPTTSQKATIWQPKAMVVKKYSDEIIAFIENLKVNLKMEAGSKKVAGIELFNEDDKKAANFLFSEKGMGKEMHDKLKEFRRNILSIDIQMDSVFRQTFLVIDKRFDTSNSKQQDFTRTFFANKTVVAALAMLTSLQNNVKVNENRMIAFCLNKVGSNVEHYTTYLAIISQNYSHIKSGGRMEITAGIGAFSKTAIPEITVNGKSIELDESGLAVYKFNASSKTGKHSIPVKIKFIDEVGNKQVITKIIEYTVIK